MIPIRSMIWLMLLFLVGCGGAEKQSVTPTKVVDLKTILNQVAESGNLEEAKEGISIQLEKLEEKDASKARDLAVEFAVLVKATTPAKIKEQAKKMAEKL